MVNRIIGVLLFCVIMLAPGYAGVVVEGGALGIEPIKTVEYSPEQNAFVINGGKILKSPVESDILIEIIDAVNLDERIGVSVTLSDELIVYGKLHKRSEAAGMLEEADNFMRSVVFAEYSRLRKYTLPQNYKPVQVASRERSSVIYLELSDFEYRDTGSAYVPGNFQAEVMLIPMATYTAPDGGYLPDYDALEKGVYQQEDKANADHINMYKNEYLQLQPMRKAIKVGRASAIVRRLRDSGINMDELSRSIIEGKGITLVGKEGVTGDEPKVVKMELLTGVSEPVGAVEEISDFELEDIAEVVLNDDKSESLVEVAPESGKDYTESIRQVFLIDKIIGNTNKVKLSRKSVNDGSYVAYRTRYLDEIKNSENIDLSKTPVEFQQAFNEHIKAWEETLAWLKNKKVEEGEAGFSAFYAEHGRFRKELKDTYNKCKLIAAEYQVEN